MQRDSDDVEKGEGAEYGWVVTNLGNRRILVECNDGISRQINIRYRPGWCRQYINVGDLILVGIREFAEETGDVLHKYSYEQAKKLVALGKVRRAPDSEVEKVLLLPTDGGLETDDDLDFIFEEI
jgi:translation initiation factor 1A